MLEEHWPQVLGIIVSVIGVIFLFLKWFSYQLRESIKTMQTGINDRIDIEVSRLNAEGDKLSEGITAVRNQLTDRVRNIETSVVYRDVFDQHCKVIDARHETVLMMHETLTEQLKTATTTNTTEHARICGKMDAIPQIIQETIRLLVPDSRR